MHDFHGTFRDLLHAANLRHGAHGFTSLPKEGVLRIFSPIIIIIIIIQKTAIFGTAHTLRTVLM